MVIDTLIVGQGLAGSLLAWHLLQQGQRVLVIDHGATNASQVAAGLINPVTGQRLVKSNDVEILLPYALNIYQQLSQQFGQGFYHSIEMLRLLTTPMLNQYAEKRLQQIEYRNLITPGNIDGESGIATLKQLQTGYLDTKPLLEALKQHLIQHKAYSQNEFDVRQIDPASPIWQNQTVGNIVFCQGYQVYKNPWFQQLPFRPTQGEIITCRTNAFSEQAILNYGQWLIPLNQNTFKIGATQIPDCLELQPSERAKLDLIKGLKTIRPNLATGLSIMDHAVGIRPATSDRQPIIGSHPRYPKLHIFNGFGSKGSLSIPWYAQKMTMHLNGNPQHFGASDIARFHYVG